MIHNCSDISSQESILRNACQPHDQKIQPNDSELYLLIQRISGVKNTGEKKINSRADNIPVKTGLVKSLIIGAVTLTGIGALGALAICGYYYIAGGASSDLPENSRLSRLSAPAMANIIPWETDSRLSTTLADTPEALMNLPITTETAPSPYSYYEDIYGDTAAKNNNSPSTSLTTTEKPATTTGSPVTTTEKPVTIKEPVMMTTGRSTSAYMTVKPTITTSSTSGADAAVTDYKHESGRSVYYQTVKGKYNYPLGTKFFNELLAFCLKETKYDIEQAYLGTQELRCKLLGDINDKIEALKEYETLVRRINAEKEILSAKEHGEEIMLRRKLATLYLAAGAIINKKDFDVFLREVNRDYKKHSTQELEQREEKIMNYFLQEC